MVEWIAQHDLVILNRGDKPTFEIQGYGSVLDLTLATPDIAINILKWEVSDNESLSDHNYLVFEVHEKVDPLLQKKDTEHRWNIKKLDAEKLRKATDKIAANNPNKTAQELSRTLQKICNDSMPKKKQAHRSRPVYWWNEGIAVLRKDCIKKRRIYTRSKQRTTLEVNLRLWDDYCVAKKKLRNSIKTAKRACWKTLCNDIDRDIWGDGYKIAMKRLSGYPPRNQMTMEAVENIVSHLFPHHEPVVFPLTVNSTFDAFTLDEINTACRKLKNNKAPGPGNVPPEIIKYVTLRKPDYVLAIYNELALNGCFPTEWKRSKLILLRKGDKPLDNPSSYRPICLLDVEGKLFEHLILGRLKRELERTGNLAENQYGFREGRQTVDAIKQVIIRAAEAAEFSSQHRRFCAVITLDVKNAFNSASWQIILDVLRHRRIDEGLVNIIASYLSEREIILEAERDIKALKINSGVPQGSVLRANIVEHPIQ